MLRINESEGIPMGFNVSENMNDCEMLKKHQGKKRYPTDSFYQTTKNLAFQLLELLTERGRIKKGRVFEEIIDEMDRTWATLLQFSILTKHLSK